MVTAIRSKVNLTHVDEFTSAVQSLAQGLGVTVMDNPMPISKFKSDYSGLLRVALNGSVQQISRGRERYVILTEKQVIAMARSSSKGNTLADTLASIQIPSMRLDASVALVAGAKQEQYSLMDSGS